MSAARLAIDDWSRLCAPVDEADARAMLEGWRADGAKLGFGYFRSGAGVMQTGTATLLRVSPQLLTLDTGGSRLVVVLDKARFEFGNLGFLTADFRGLRDVRGLSVFLHNNDWLCLLAGPESCDPSLLARAFGVLS